MSTKTYAAGGRTFTDVQAAIDWANFIARVSGLIVAVEEVKE